MSLGQRQPKQQLPTEISGHSKRVVSTLWVVCVLEWLSSQFANVEILLARYDGFSYICVSVELGVRESRGGFPR